MEDLVMSFYYVFISALDVFICNCMTSIVGLLALNHVTAIMQIGT